MKKNMRRVLYALVCLIMCTVMYAQSKSPVLSGEWSFSAPDAPYGYQSGTLKFTEKEGKLTAVVVISGSELTISNIEREGDSYACSFYVDGTPVSLTFKQDNNKLAGTADADGSSIQVEFTKVSKKK